MFNFTVYPRYKLLILTCLVEGIVLMVALIIAKYCGVNLLPLTQNVFRDIVIGTFGALFPLALFMLLLSEKAEGLPSLGSLRSVIINDIRAIFSEAKFTDLCLIAVCAGLAEELLFRGVIQVKLGIVGASIIFGLLHFITPAYFVIATIMGFYLGILYQYYDSLLIPIQLHFIYDLGALVYLKYFVKSQANQ
ncbi:MAG: lysostaphin resistance A-like protein [Candidatus Scalindua sp.]